MSGINFSFQKEKKESFPKQSQEEILGILTYWATEYRLQPRVGKICGSYVPLLDNELLGTRIIKVEYIITRH